MEKYTKFTAQSVKEEFSSISKKYIGPNSKISYKHAARELEVEERTLGSWIRGEKQINFLSLLKLFSYLPPEFTDEILRIGQDYDDK
jgi:hypothetical protein